MKIGFLLFSKMRARLIKYESGNCDGKKNQIYSKIKSLSIRERKRNWSL